MTMIANKKKENMRRFIIAFGFGLMLAAVAVLYSVKYTMGDGDYFWHVALGRDILKTGSIVHADQLSWLAEEQGLVYIDHSWLADILLYLLSTIGASDLVGAVLFNALTAFSLAFCVFLFWENLDCDIKGCLIAGAAMVSLFETANMDPRPQQISVILLVVTLKILQVLQENPHSKTALLLPLLAIAWANLHGGTLLLMLGFIAMFMVLALVPDFQIGRAYHTRKGSAKVYGILLVVCTVVGLANPYGVKIYQQYENVARACNIIRINEWAAPSIDGVSTIKLLLAVLILLTLYRKSISLTELAPVGATGLMALLHIRNVLWFCAALAVYVLRNGNKLFAVSFKTPSTPIQNRIAKGIFAVGFSGLTIVAAVFFPKAVRNQPYWALSDELVQTIGVVSPERLYTDINVGPSVIRAGFKDAFDCRIDLFPDDLLQSAKYLSKNSNSAYIAEALKEYRFDALLFLKTDASMLISYFNERNDWTLVYDDRYYSLFIPASDTASFLQTYMTRNGVKQDDGTVLEPVYLGTDIAIHYADTKQVNEMLERGDSAVVWFGNPTDNDCRAMLPALYEKLREQGVSELTVCDIEQYKMVYGFDENCDLYIVQNRTEGYDELLAAFHDFLPDNIVPYPDPAVGEVNLGDKVIPAAMAVKLDGGTATVFCQ